MNVLLVELDLYQTIGGGQTIYRRIIERNPGIQFYYLGEKETANASRPSNAHLLRYVQPYCTDNLKGEFSDTSIPQWAYPDFIIASNIAASAEKVRIDVVDIPDYKVFGYFMRPALQRHGQKNCRIVISLHGNLSETQALNWGGPTVGTDISVDQREQWQYRVADARYGISRDYIEHWTSISGVAADYVNPLRLIDGPRLVPFCGKAEGVALNFIGRAECTKGPDLFVELLSWLPAGSYRAAAIFGPEVKDRYGNGSTSLLRRMGQRRGLSLDIHPSVSAVRMRDLFASRSLTVLPSRRDSFNLVALESLFAGCPVALSIKAGACRFLRETYPDVPFTAIDVDRLYTCVPDILKVLREYDRHREAVSKAVVDARPKIDGASLERVYEREDISDSMLRLEAAELYRRVVRFYERHRVPAYARLVTNGVRVCDGLRYQTEGSKKRDPRREADLWHVYREIFYLPENSATDIDAKVEEFGLIAANSRIARARTWAELARLERIRGNDIVAATYDIRVMRATGRDRLGTLSVVDQTLREHGFVREAEVCLGLFGPQGQRFDRCSRLLEDARTAFAMNERGDFEVVCDHRRPLAPKVSVIVSLYRAANKLGTFVRMLCQQPWIGNGLAEVVFIDSHSPTEELTIFRELIPELGISALFARTRDRETIQKAWNRGVDLARAPYLVFLGVDEMLRPETLPLLAHELDVDPQLDWVQGSSVMTEVNEYGTPQRDVMAYMRTPYHPHLVYLDTCYLSWVGAMYRKSIHDRFGFYDPTFGAAGDTEFKNRVLPVVRTKTLPRSLGIFLNYPEARTTESPRAEIEDLRAWYLHRSPAGVAYALADRGNNAELELFKRAVSYRKSYCDHVSCDLAFADAIATNSARWDGAVPAAAADCVRHALNVLQDLEWLDVLSPMAPIRRRLRAESVLANEAKTVQETLGLAETPVWLAFNDNRFEQHSGVWRGTALEKTFVHGSRAYWRRLKSVPSEAALAAIQSDNEAASEAARPMKEEVVSQIFDAIRRRIDALRAAGDQETARDLETIGRYMHGVCQGNGGIPTEAGNAAGWLVRMLGEAYQGRTMPMNPAFDERLLTLCEEMASMISDHCPELGDGFFALSQQMSQRIDEARSTAIAARLLTYANPTDAAKRHRTSITPGVINTLQRAAEGAKSNGNAAYNGRLTVLIKAIQTELAQSGLLNDRQSQALRVANPESTAVSANI